MATWSRNDHCVTSTTNNIGYDTIVYSYFFLFTQVFQMRPKREFSLNIYAFQPQFSLPLPCADIDSTTTTRYKPISIIHRNLQMANVHERRIQRRMSCVRMTSIKHASDLCVLIPDQPCLAECLFIFGSLFGFVSMHGGRIVPKSHHINRTHATCFCLQLFFSSTSNTHTYTVNTESETQCSTINFIWLF